MNISLSSIWYKDDYKIASWSPASRDHLHALKHRLNGVLLHKLSRRCTHIKNHGGVKASIKAVNQLMPYAKYVARFDIYQYYRNINHAVLLKQLSHMLVDCADYNIIKDYLSLPDLKNSGAGMIAGGSLSPILAAVYLHPLDQLMRTLRQQKKIVLYTRYMDDFVILCKSRWQLKKAIAKMHQILEALEITVHPDKRFIGKTIRGFDFLRVQFQQGRKLLPSKESYRRLRINARRLHEQGADNNRLLQYVMRWQRWIFAGLKGLVSHQGGMKRLIKSVLYYLKKDRMKVQE